MLVKHLRRFWKHPPMSPFWKTLFTLTFFSLVSLLSPEKVKWEIGFKMDEEEERKKDQSQKRSKVFRPKRKL